MKKNRSEKENNISRIQVIIQGSYIFAWLITTYGIVGNLELNVATPIPCLIINGLLSFLVIGKLSYWYKRGRLF